MTLQADLQALETDANTWDDVSSTLSSAAGTATGLHLGTPQLSWAAEVTGLTSTYSTVREFMASRLTEGSTATAEMASGLRTVKAAFEGTDGSTANRFDGLWDAVSE